MKDPTIHKLLDIEFRLIANEVSAALGIRNINSVSKHGVYKPLFDNRIRYKQAYYYRHEDVQAVKKEQFEIDAYCQETMLLLYYISEQTYINIEELSLKVFGNSELCNVINTKKYNTLNYEECKKFVCYIHTNYKEMFEDFMWFYDSTTWTIGECV